MKFMEAVKHAFSHYATFTGRARRSEYWYFALFTFLVAFVAGLLGSLIFGSDSRGAKVLTYLVELVFFIPGLAISWRRLHDIGKSGAWTLASAISTILTVFLLTTSAVLGIVGSGGVGALLILSLLLGIAALVFDILMLVWLCRDSQPEENRFGPNPKAVPAEAAPAEAYEPVSYAAVPAAPTVSGEYRTEETASSEENGNGDAPSGE